MIDRVAAGRRVSRGNARWTGWKGVGLLLGAGSLVGAAVSLQASCAQTPTAVPVQSFQRPENVDVVCMQVLDSNGNAIVPAIPQPQSQCAPVPVNITGSTLPYHLLALVTQTTAGAVAVVDLTAGNVVDEDPGTPGINFLPVGTVPTGIASTPDGVMTFVGSASPNLPAIYALPSSVVLGDSQDAGVGLIPTLTTWPACLLPQAPGALAIVPTSLLAREDAGASTDEGDGGAPAASGPGYVLVAVLPGDSAHPATVATFDPTPFLRGAGNLVDAGIDPSGPSVPPGSLVSCDVALIQRVALAAPAASTTWSPGPAWDDGIKYVDGGVDAEVPLTGVSCSATDAGGGALFSGNVPAPLAGPAALDTSGAHPILYVADTQLPVIHAVDLYDPQAPVELAPYLATSIADPSRSVSVGKLAVSPTTRDFKRFLYAIDQIQGSIMVYDVTDPANGPHVPLTRPHPEVTPLQPPDRILFSAPVATLAFAVHDWPLEQIVQPGVNGGASNEIPLLTAQTGLLCNPNPNVDPTTAEQNNNGGFTPDQGPFADPGAFYRANAGNQQLALGPTRLRGIFAFVTLSNGNVVTIDVDDWDAPCRRPDPMAAPGETSGPSPPVLSSSTAALVEGPLSSIAPPEPAPGPGDNDPYHAPLSYQTYDNNSPVTLEWYFPVSAPHRLRSSNFLQINQTVGNHAPYLVATPQLYSLGAPIATQGNQSVVNPSLVPTDTPFVDPSLQSNPTEQNPADRTSVTVATTTDAGFSADGGLDASIAAVGDASAAAITLIQSSPGAAPGVRFAWEDPTTQVDQDWVVTYEGQLPGFYDNSGNPLVVANVVVPPGTPDGGAYETVWLQSPDAYFCRKGVEDFAIGQQRAAAVSAELTKDGLPTLASYGQRVADYVQLTDDIRDSTDGYWNLPNTCWTDPQTNTTIAVSDRNNLCNSVFGSSLDPSDPSTARDFPILEAYDDHLVIGRFGYPDGDTDGGVNAAPRQVVSSDPTNVPFLTLMQCCFANQVHFNVRTGGEWSAVGSNVAFLNHVAASGSDNRCAPTCDERNALLNGRSPPVPRPVTQSTALAACPPPFVPSIIRDSPLALRNPMFSFLIWDGQDPTNACADVEPVRDMAWKFSTAGQVVPQTLDLAATTTAVSPQTMKFIDSLGQLAIIDGESQGLILFDLGTLAEAHTPYF